MNTSQSGELVRHLSETELEEAIENAQSADETRLVRRCVSSRISIRGIPASRQGDASGSLDPRRVDGLACGMMAVQRDSARASAAAGR